MMLVSPSHIARVGRPALWSENMQARFKAGTFGRIAALLRPGESRTDFVRDAVERELERRSGASG